MKLSHLGEFGLIERIRARAGQAPELRLGIGDDCAALQCPEGQLLLTTKDLLIEGVHFRLDWTDLKDLGRKSVSVNISDIAAMGGRPLDLYLGLGIPAGFTVEQIDRFMEGFAEAATGYGASLSGGDTCRSPGPLLISVTAHGAVAPEQLVRRSGAAPGDAICVSGTLGDSALALKALLAGEQPHALLADRHHNPDARPALGRALAEASVASAMIDISDGLAADLGHILDASGVGAVLDIPALPLSQPFFEALEKDPSVLQLALHGGEDYELLFTLRPDRLHQLEPLAKTLGLPLTRIGTLVRSEEGLRLRDARGRFSSAHPSGFNHFRA